MLRNVTSVPDRVDLPATLAEHVRTQLEDAITEGRLAGGQRIREIELAEVLGVSRTPVREALRTLERVGLVVRSRGRGTFIAPRLEAPEVLTLYAVRLTLEPFLAGRAATRLVPASLDAIANAQRDFRQLANKSTRRPGDIRSMLIADTKIHMTMYLEAESALATVVESYWARTLRERSFLYEGSGRASLLEFSEAHDGIVDALQRRNSEDASHLVEQHLRSGVAVLRERLSADGSARA